jgi:hypothetical protein
VPCSRFGRRSRRIACIWWAWTPRGWARLKLRPRYELDGQERVIRVDAPPTYDSPPDIDELFRAAAKNHELEHAYEAQRNATRTKRRETERELRDHLPQAFSQ